MKWEVSPAVVWVSFEDSTQWIAYCEESADLHLLNEGARALWQTVARSPGTTTDQLLALHADPSLENESRSAIRETISSMDRAGLLQPVVE